MTTDESTHPSNLVPSEPRELTARSSALARRALDDIAHMAPSSHQIEHLLSTFHRGYDVDAYARAAQAIIQFAPYLDIKDDNIGTLALFLVGTHDALFTPGGVPRPLEATTEYHGERYFPPNQEFRSLLLAALQSLVGPVTDPIDAVVVIFSKSGRRTRIRAARWLALPDIPNAVSLLQDALAHTQDEFFTLALRYALLFHDKEDLDTIVHAIADYAARCSSDKELDWCFDKLWSFRFSPLSAETLGRLACTLSTSHHEHDRRAAATLVLAFFNGPDSPNDPGTGIKRLKYCSDDVLEGLTRIAWQEHLRLRHLHEPYISLHVGARGALYDALVRLDDEIGAPSPLDFPDPGDRDCFQNNFVELLQLLDHGRQRAEIEAASRTLRDASSHAPTYPVLERLVKNLLSAGYVDFDLLTRARGLVELAKHRYQGPIESVNSHYYLARTYFHMADHVQAINHYRRAIRARQALSADAEPDPSLGPDLLNVHYGLAASLYELGRLEDALPSFETAAHLGHPTAPEMVLRCKQEMDKP
jgi:tetratricopeptide (TPR) repeat protein